MSATVLCAGCGGRVAIPGDYTRARIRCPDCGVMSDVPAAAPKPAGGTAAPRRSSSAEADAESILLGSEPPPAAKPAAKRKPAAPPLHPLPPNPNEKATNEDDGRPYRVPGIDEERPCPQCQRSIPRDAVLCTSCGYNLQTGKKAKKEYELVDRRWQGGWSVRTRRGLFIALLAITVTSGIIATRAGGMELFGVLCPGVFVTLMTAFLLGTYEQIHLTRNKKGRVHLTKTWCACFVPRPTQEVELREYGGVVYQAVDATSMLDWTMLIILLLTGVVPGLLWIYFVFIRTTYEVGLSKGHGYLDFIIYRGMNEAMVLDIAHTVENVAHLPCTKN